MKPSRSARKRASCGAVQARQVVVGHADHAEPLGLELDAGERREEAAQGALRPGPVHRAARAAQRADAAEDEAAGLVEAERAEDRLGVPDALSLREDGP